MSALASGQYDGQQSSITNMPGALNPRKRPSDPACYIDEVVHGLPTVKPLLDCALENQAFYDREGERYLPQRDAESTFDFMGRPKRQSGLLHQAVEILTGHLYAPGPSRQFDDSAGEAFLSQVWTDNLYDGLLHRADALATLNDVCALQFDAGSGDYSNRPLTIQMWGREEFHVWTDPDDATRPEAVVTIDRYNLQTRYRLWTEERCMTFLTKQASGTTGGRIAEKVADEENTYGCLPFGFIHYDLPVRRFFTPAPGTYLRKSEVRVDDRLSLIDEAIQKHLNPVPVAENVPLEWNPIIEPQRFIRLFSAGPALGGDGGFEGSSAAKLYYLQAMIDVAGAWQDAENYIRQVCQSVGIPINSIRMEQIGVASGIALVAEQAPLLTRAKNRRMIFAHFESKIAATMLRCAGNHYGKPELVAAADKGTLTLGWSEPTIPIPGPDRDQADLNAITMGIKSRLMVIQERYGCTRDQAVMILQQIAEDRAEEESILPTSDGSGGTAQDGRGSGVTDTEGEPSDSGKEDAGRTDSEGTDQVESEQDYNTDGYHEG